MEKIIEEKIKEAFENFLLPILKDAIKSELEKIIADKEKTIIPEK